MKRMTGLLAGIFIMIACNNATKPAATTTAPKDTTAMSATSPRYDTALVDNKKDPSCGMPVTAGIEDTTHYHNKVLGFCSKECKDAFLAAPDSFAIVYKK